jgi:hypothetical protein
MGIPELLQDRVYSVIKDSPSYRIIPISYPAQFSKADEPALHASLATEGTDILLELSLARLSFVGTDNEGPHSLSGVVKIQTKQIKIDKARSLTCWWGYNSAVYSRSYTLKEWEADHAQLLGEELREAGRQLADFIKENFVVTGLKQCPKPKKN